MSAFGTLLREMRVAQRFSQLDFSLESNVSSKHISFLETGRSMPSQQMVLHLAQVLGADLAGTNRLLSAAGFSQVFTQQDLYAPEMRMVKEALDHMLVSHMPYPAMVFDQNYNLVNGNAAQFYLIQAMVALGGKIAERPNVLLAFLDENSLKPFVEDWDQLARHMLQRIYQEHLSGPYRDRENLLLKQALELPGIPSDWKQHRVENLDKPVVSFSLRLGDTRLNMFSTIATIGTPLDVTAQSIRIEHFFPADEQTKDYWIRHCSQ
ncbi:transcriptional regulator [Hahella sp. CCB-MM4]|uniref:helix-turn-helix domain-containing protein n=1 Tax=Hahella sp. (strain CCB-MM4) TaxID=1926491 RepID=UPI000B9B5C22|nr:helix-turn-helix transcriptional regulator [Hahella sp. CCB-MM4]OZG72550.1 transcriptional regulator [Hahella sp. CCB-MM4]